MKGQTIERVETDGAPILSTFRIFLKASDGSTKTAYVRARDQRSANGTFIREMAQWVAETQGRGCRIIKRTVAQVAA